MKLNNSIKSILLVILIAASSMVHAGDVEKMPKLLEGVDQVTAGVARIMELQRQQGYAYIRP